MDLLSYLKLIILWNSETSGTCVIATDGDVYAVYLIIDDQAINIYE